MMPSSDFITCESADENLCNRIRALDPSLPLRLPLREPAGVNACPLDGRACFPLVHLVGGFHAFMEETLGSGVGAAGAQADALLSSHPDVHMEHRCFNSLDAKTGGAGFITLWPASAASKLLVAECMTGFSFYPNLAQRYAAAWTRAYWPCKASEIKLHGAKQFFRSTAWTKCRPEALAAHDAATGTGGAGHEATPPFLLRALYPAGAIVKVLAVLRQPTDRLVTSFWLHPHYGAKYGAHAVGLDTYVVETLAAWRRCEAAHGTRRCALQFENLWNWKAFFACDQLIRGIYSPFVEEWRAAFGEQLLVLRAEELLDAPETARSRVLRFVGLPPHPNASLLTPPPSATYAALHAASVRSYGGVPAHNRTRDALDAFYAPHNARLAALLGWPPSTWQASTPLAAAATEAGAHNDAHDGAHDRAPTILYKRYGPYESRATLYGEAAAAEASRRARPKGAKGGSKSKMRQGG